jgi:spore cortex formation protein SpoVR/YcgB (stage V sporulation)
LAWSERIEHFRRVRRCLLDLATESNATQADPKAGKDRIAEVMYGIVHAEEFIQQAFTPRFIEEYRAYKARDSQQGRSRGVFAVTADYSERLAAKMKYDDLNPEFDPPKSYAKFKGENN